MNKEETLEYLNGHNIPFERFDHPAVYTMEEALEIHLPWPQDEAKNLFIRDDKKRNYYLITVKGDKRVDLKQFRQKHNTRALSFASARRLKISGRSWILSRARSPRSVFSMTKAAV